MLRTVRDVPGTMATEIFDAVVHGIGRGKLFGFNRFCNLHILEYLKFSQRFRTRVKTVCSYWQCIELGSFTTV